MLHQTLTACNHCERLDGLSTEYITKQRKQTSDHLLIKGQYQFIIRLFSFLFRENDSVVYVYSYTSNKGLHSVCHFGIYAICKKTICYMHITMQLGLHVEELFLNVPCVQIENKRIKMHCTYIPFMSITEMFLI